MTTTILIIVNVFSALAIIVLALMQQSKGDMGSAFGGGGSQSMFGSRGSSNFLSRTTSIMCVVFFASSLTLAYVYAQRADSKSVIDGGSVIEESSEIPSIDGSDIPVIDGSEIPTIDGELPVIEGEVPTIEGAADAIESSVDAIEAEIPPLESVIEAQDPTDDAQEPIITQ